MPQNYVWRVLSADAVAISAAVFLLLGAIFTILGFSLTLAIITAFVGIPFAILGILFLAGGAGVGYLRFQQAQKSAQVLRDGASAGTLLLLGNAGPAMWAAFQASADTTSHGEPNPSELWCS